MNMAARVLEQEHDGRCRGRLLGAGWITNTEAPQGSKRLGRRSTGDTRTAEEEVNLSKNERKERNGKGAYK